MSDDTIRKAVAAALWEHDLHLGGVSFTTDQREEYRELADAAIAAARPVIERAMIERLAERAEAKAAEEWHYFGYDDVPGWIRSQLEANGGGE